MNSTWYRALVVSVLLVAVAVVVSARKPAGETAPPQAGVPRLLELGSVTCVPCKMMEPILEELRNENPGKLHVDFVDVLKEKKVAEEFGIEVIPTQVFFQADGKEFFRHTGFFPKEEILAAFRKHGISLAAAEPKP